MPNIKNRAPKPHVYNPDEDLTNEQLHRFMETAKKAEKRHELEHMVHEQEEKLSALEQAEHYPVAPISPQEVQRRTRSYLWRFVGWFVVFCVLCVVFVTM